MKRWNDKKNFQLAIEKIYFNLAETEKDKTYYLKKAIRLHECGSWLSFLECPHGHKESVSLKNANFCKVRLCSYCQWRRSLFVYHQFLTVAHKVQEIAPGTKYLFMTLTGKNVTAQELPQAITHYIKSLERLVNYKNFRVIKGIFRTLEITYNSKKNTYHPHFHLIAAVEKSYFTERNYISQKKLTGMWQKAFQVSYTPIVDIRKVRPKLKNQKTVLNSVDELQNNLAGAAAEVAKYAVKFSDVLQSENKNEVVKVLDNALAGRRLVAYSGVMKEAYKALKLNDVDESDLIDVENSNFDKNCQCEICKSELIQTQYLFNFVHNKYAKVEIKNNKKREINNV